MRITGPTKLKVELLSCTLFKTRTKKPRERLYLSIKEKGIREPLLVSLIDEKYEIVDGFQRFTVAKDLGCEEVPSLIIEDITERELHEIAFLRNTLQSSLAPIEKAIYIKKLKNSFTYKNVELAALLGVQKSYITELLLIFNLGDWAIRKLKKRQGLTVAHARILSRCKKLRQDKKRLKEIIRKIIDEKWSIKRLRYELRRLRFLEDTDPYINIDGLFNRINSMLNQSPGRFTRSLKIYFDDLWDLRQKLTETSKILSRFAEFLPEEIKEEAKE